MCVQGWLRWFWAIYFVIHTPELSPGHMRADLPAERQTRSTVSQYRHAYHKLSPLAANRHAGTLVQVDGKRPTRLVTEPSSRLQHASASLSEPPFSCYRAVPLRPKSNVRGRGGPHAFRGDFGV